MKYLGISGLLRELRELREGDDEKISLERILNGGGENPYFALFLMALLSLIPTPAPIPVISNFFGILCCIIVLQILRGREKVVLPKFLGSISMKKQTLDRTIAKINPFFDRVERMTRERFNFIWDRALFYIVNILLLMISVAMVVPIPLLSAVPSTAMIVATFGLLNRDGLL
ncbi:MAG: exopolysaccharide biosynthesis protein, partial [Rickettsiales bacterium]|nr:exopolysaccharide biosynthesis protein [Rickettsiales bacterium]